jgi:DNA-nicking Smr family endonuclease
VAGYSGKQEDETAVVEIPIEDVLDLHTFQPKEIPQLLDDYLRACFDARIYSVRIVHGKGQGILRDLVRRVLGKMSRVASFSEAPSDAGGWGATMVELRREGG